MLAVGFAKTRATAQRGKSVAEIFIKKHTIKAKYATLMIIQEENKETVKFLKSFVVLQ